MASPVILPYFECLSMLAPCESDATGSPGPTAHIHGCFVDELSMVRPRHLVQLRQTMSATRLEPTIFEPWTE